jgi:membrane-associated progesterone receptor component
MSKDGQQKERFAPKEPVQLAPPKDDPISLDYLSKCNGEPSHRAQFPCDLLNYTQSGENDGYPTLVAIKVCHSLSSSEPHRYNVSILTWSALTKDQGTVFDVSGKETYAPGKGYHGLSDPIA